MSDPDDLPPFPSTHEGVLPRNKPSKASKRSKTGGLYQSSGTTLGAEPFANKLWKDLKENLVSQNLATSRMVQQHFHWLLPKRGATERELLIYETLRTNPIIVGNADLNEIIELEPSTLQSPATLEGHHFYVRSWTLALSELEAVMEYLSEEDNTFAEMKHWRAVIALHRARLAGGSYFLTIRYIGTVRGPRRPIDRFYEDIVQPQGGILPEFHAAVEILFPEVARAAEVHLIKEASLDFVAQYNADDVERVLIEFFGHSSLLNRQRGGFYSSYIPSDKDVVTFASLNTMFYSRFMQHARLPASSLRDGVATHFEVIQQYVNDNPQESGAATHPFTDHLRDVMATQATPYPYGDSGNLIVFIGKDITFEEYIAENSFIGGKSRAGMLTRDFIRYLASIEEDTRGESWFDKGLDLSFFRFVDLWPWLKHKNVEQAMEFLQQYLALVRPLICATYSRVVNGIVTTNFVHQYGLPSTSFTDHVGVPSIQYYSDPAWKDISGGSPGVDDAFINIPHIHPGRDKYGEQAPALRRALDMTMQMTFLIASIAMDTVELLLESGKNRAELCSVILATLENFLESTPAGQNFKQEFALAKADLRRWLSGDQWRMLSEDVRPILGTAASERLAVLGYAVGEPNSKERTESLVQLWNMNLPDLHLYVPREEERRKEWYDQFKTLQEGQSYFLQVLSKLPVDDYQEKLLKQLRPSWAIDDSWMSNASQRADVVIKSGLWVHKPRGLNVKGKQKRPSASFPDVWRDVASMQGHNIGISATKGKFVLRWKKPDKKTVSLRLNAPFAIPSGDNEVRAVSFTKAGLDIIDAAGNPLRPKLKNGGTPAASIPRSQFLSTEPGELLIELWRAVLVHRKIDSGEDAIQGTAWPGTKGVDRLPRNSKQEKPPQHRPPQPMDANYLLDQFLNLRFPTGGIFRTATVDKFPDSTEDLQGFVLFLQQPQYRLHPYSEKWLADLDRETPITAVLAPNLSVLRSVRTEPVVKQRTTRTKQVSETRFHLGPPGSAVPWVDKSKKDTGESSKRKARRSPSEGGDEDDKTTTTTSATTTTTADPSIAPPSILRSQPGGKTGKKT